MNIVTVIIDDVEYNLKGDENEEYLHQIALYVDKKIKNIKGKNEKLSISSAAVLTAINIADDMFKSQDIYKEMVNRHKEMEEKYNIMQDENTSLRKHVEHLEAYNCELKGKIGEFEEGQSVQASSQEAQRELEVLKLESEALKDKTQRELKALREQKDEILREKEELKLKYENLIEEEKNKLKKEVDSLQEDKKKLEDKADEDIKKKEEELQNKLEDLKNHYKEAIDNLEKNEVKKISDLEEEKDQKLKELTEIKYKEIEELKNTLSSKINNLENELKLMEDEAKKYKKLYTATKEEGKNSKFQLQNYKYKVLEYENKISEQSIELAKARSLKAPYNKK